MSSTLEKLTQRRRNAPVPLVPGAPQGRSIPIGIVATILLHAVLYFVTPRTFYEGTPRQANTQDDLEILLTSDDEPQQDPMRFFETNPDKPDNEPDDPKFFAAQNQQAAQENPTQDNSETPTTEGKDIPSNAIVSGLQVEPQTATNPGQESQSVQQAQELATQSRNEALMPLPGFEKVEGENEEGIGTNVAENSTRPRPVEEKREGEEQPAEEQVVVATQQSTPGRPSPQPRPRLPNTRPTVLANQPYGVSNAGQIGVDAKFSEFGDYLQELIEVVQAEWNRILSRSATYPQAGSRVSITFTLAANGQIIRRNNVDENAGRFGTDACLAAITNPQPYRPWTREMVAILGDEQVITFHFYYW